MSVKVITTSGLIEVVKGGERWDISPEGYLVVTSNETAKDSKGDWRYRSRAVFAAHQWVGVKLADA